MSKDRQPIPIEEQLNPRIHPAYRLLANNHQRWRAENTADYLKLCLNSDLISLDRTTRIVEFGTGPGTSTIAHAQFAALNNGSVIALENNELNENNGNRLIASGLLPESNIIIGDGIRYLEEIPTRGEQCDLLTAPFLAINSGELTQSLIKSARNALSQQGVLLITSDNRTMLDAKKIFDEQEIPYRKIVAGTDPFNYGHFGLITSFGKRQLG